MIVDIQKSPGRAWAYTAERGSTTSKLLATLDLASGSIAWWTSDERERAHVRRAFELVQRDERAREETRKHRRFR